MIQPETKLNGVASQMPHTPRCGASKEANANRAPHLKQACNQAVLPMQRSCCAPFFDPAALPNSRLLAQVLHGWSGIFSSADHPALANYVKMILQEMQTRSLNYEISVRGLFVALITEVMRLSTEQNDSASANRMVIAPALTYIDEFYMENFSIRDLADACSMSESHFRRVFRELVGMGPLDYLNRTRIAKSLQPFAHDR